MMKIKLPTVASFVLGAMMSASLIADSSAEGTMDLERPISPPAMSNFGSIPGNKQVATNFTEIIDDLVYNIVRKQDRFLVGANLDTSDVYYKLTLASTSMEDGVAPALEYLYASQLSEGAAIYGPNMKKLTDFDGTKGWRYIVDDEGTPCVESINSNGHVDYWTFTTAPVTGAVIKAVFTPPSSYDFSHPHDWRIVWRALDDPDTSVVDTELLSTNHAGQIKSEFVVGVIKNNKAELGLAIMQNHRRKGYAAAVIEKMADYATSVLHLHQLYVIIAASNTGALELFKKAGYAASLTLRDWLFDGKKYENAIALQTFL